MPLPLEKITTSPRYINAQALRIKKYSFQLSSTPKFQSSDLAIAISGRSNSPRQMEGVAGGGVPADSPVIKKIQEASRVYQFYLDKSTPHAIPRWIGTLVFALIFGIRIYYLQGFYVVTYALGIYILSLLIGFLSPLVDPELEVSDGPLLPTKGSDEFKPFMRRLPEFKFWYSVTKAFSIAFMTTFFSAFDVPVFWPILLFYWIVLFVLTMKKQIAHMIKYKYIPFNIGKQKYGGKKSYGSSAGSSAD